MRKLINKIKKTPENPPTKFSVGDPVSWLGMRGTVEGIIGSDKYVVHAAGYIVEVWESELTLVGTSTSTIE